MTRVALVDGLRTPFARAGTLFLGTPAEELARIVVRELIERTELDPAGIDEVIFGNVTHPPDALNIARIISVRSGIPLSVPSHTVGRNCASGLEAITEAFDRIRSGQAHTIVAGGTESMSNAPFILPSDVTRFAWRFNRSRSFWKRLRSFRELSSSRLRPRSALRIGLTDPLSGLRMGDTAEILAKEFRISRQEQDEFTFRSRELARRAEEKKRWAQEIVPVYLDGEPDAVTRDAVHAEPPTLESLTELAPAFDRRHGTVTPGNSSPIADGAAALLLMSEARVRVLGISPLAWIRSYAYVGLDPRRMGLGPAVSTALALRRAGLSMREIGLVEINEAFAAQVLAVLRVFEKPTRGESVGANAPELGPIRPDILNVNGGALALGHPVGASGTRITLTLAKQMRGSGVPFGLASLCVGGGQGGSILLENA